jgi:hypothetical protein
LQVASAFVGEKWLDAVFAAKGAAHLFCSGLPSILAASCSFSVRIVRLV